MDSDWKFYTQPPHTNIVYEIILGDFSIRKCKIKPNLDPCSLWYVDTTHPMQQALVDRSSIMAWRETSGKV